MSNKVDRSEPTAPIVGEVPSSLAVFWRDTVREQVKHSPDLLETAARQLVTATSLLQAIYFAAVSISDVKDVVAPPALYAFIIPIPFWLLGLIFAIRVFVPRMYESNLDSPDIARDTFLRIVRYKYTNLRIAQSLLLISFFPLLINVWMYLTSP
jgi:hypothetical protein